MAVYDRAIGKLRVERIFRLIEAPGLACYKFKEEQGQGRYKSDSVRRANKERVGACPTCAGVVFP
jgi:hypothetical protein